jgi:polysaccharide pyruvyl transferase WcaK-like protein
VIGVGLYDYRGRGAGSEEAGHDYRHYIEKISHFVAYLVEREYEVRILIGDIRYDTPVREDLRASLMAMGIAYSESGITDESISSVKNLFEQIESTDIVVATRFHNVLISLILNKPVISISYNEKNDSVMAETGLAEHCLRIADFEVSQLIEILKGVEKEAERIRERIRKRTVGYRNALEDQYQKIFSPHGLKQRFPG